MEAHTIIKVHPVDHQALIALLDYTAKKIGEETFRQVMIAQGRDLKDGILTSGYVELIAEQLSMSFR